MTAAAACTAMSSCSVAANAEIASEAASRTPASECFVSGIVRLIARSFKLHVATLRKALAAPLRTSAKGCFSIFVNSSMAVRLPLPTTLMTRSASSLTSTSGDPNNSTTA